MGPFHIGIGDLLVGLVAAIFVVMPFTTLVHELGHGLVALRVSCGPVVIHVGRPPIWLGVDFERLKIRWSPVPPRGVPFAGLCVWDPRSVSNRGMFAVIVAGPLAKALLLPVLVSAAVWSAEMPQWIPATFGWSALIAFISLLSDADPRPEESERANPAEIRRDGPRALAAYRAWRAE